jgi:hypothetical protein
MGVEVSQIDRVEAPRIKRTEGIEPGAKILSHRRRTETQQKSAEQTYKMIHGEPLAMSEVIEWWRW